MKNTLDSRRGGLFGNLLANSRINNNASAKLSPSALGPKSTLAGTKVSPPKQHTRCVPEPAAFHQRLKRELGTDHCMPTVAFWPSLTCTFFITAPS